MRAAPRSVRARGVAYTFISQSKARAAACEPRTNRQRSFVDETHEAQAEESLTDVIDQMARNAFRRALERRHVTPAYRILVESAHLVPPAP